MNSGFRENFACGIRNTAQVIRNPTKDWNSESRIQVPLTGRLEQVPGIWNPRRGIQSLSRTVLDSLPWGDMCRRNVSGMNLSVY